MTSNAVVLKVASALEATGVNYMLVGGFSASAWGMARSTKDADFVIELSGHSFADLTKTLKPEFHSDPQAVLEFNTLTTRFVLTHVETAFTIELFLLSEDAFDQERFARRVQVPFLGHAIWMPTAEDVVVMKLRWFASARRNKDVDDVEGILAVQRERLDMPYIRRWCKEHGTLQLLEEVFDKIRQSPA